MYSFMYLVGVGKRGVWSQFLGKLYVFKEYIRKPGNRFVWPPKTKVGLPFSATFLYTHIASNSSEAASCGGVDLLGTLRCNQIDLQHRVLVVIKAKGHK